VNDVTTILSSTVRLSVPLAFAACGEYVAERAGTLNLSVEAMMLSGAYAGAIGSSVMHNAAAGLVWGIAIGIVVGAIQATMSHRVHANQFVVAITLNVLALGATSYLASTLVMHPHQAGILTIPFVSHVPIVGRPLFSERWPAFVLYALVPFVWWVMQRRRWGLELRAVGENPAAADVTGIDVDRRRRQALLWCGALSGLGGAFLAVGEVGTFTTNMTAGRGYIVIAAVIFGGWTLRGTIAGCFLFGGADALRLALPAIGYTLNPQLLVVAPYVLPLAVMAVFSVRRRQPAALAQPFERAAT
jgi:simple sugar transport system permease protein